MSNSTVNCVCSESCTSLNVCCTIAHICMAAQYAVLEANAKVSGKTCHMSSLSNMQTDFVVASNISPWSPKELIYKFYLELI